MGLPSLSLKQVPTSSPLSRVLQSPDRTLIISKLVEGVQNAPTVQVKPNVSSVRVGGYSPQDTLWQGNSSSAGTGAHMPTPDPEDTSAQSSEIYSVVAVHVPAEKNKDDQQDTSEDKEASTLPLSSSGESWDKDRTSPKLTSHGVPPLLNQDDRESSLAQPLLLNTVRDSKGQLMLPSLTFQLQSSAGDAVSPLNSERKPLLSDLIDSKREGPSLASLQSIDSSEWSDSGCDDSTVNTPTQPYCNSHYFPSQPVNPDFQMGCQNTSSSDAIFDSGYKQNWMPAILCGTASEDSCEYRRTNYPWTWTAPKKDEEGEEDEYRGGEERLRKIHLEGWVVQIQE